MGSSYMVRKFQSLIRDSNPIIFRHKNCHCHGSPDARLIKAWKPSVAIEGLKMSVNVNFTVNWIYITVET